MTRRLPALLCLFFLVSACEPPAGRPEPEWTDLRGRYKECVLAVFPPETTTREMNHFLEETTHGPPVSSGGFTFKQGIGAVIKWGGLSGHPTGYLICFWPNIEPDRKRAIVEGIKRSPLVERVLEGEEAVKTWKR